MARFYGSVGFVETVETRPGIWEPKETVRLYYGDVNRNATRWSANTDSTNDDLALNSQISIVADAFAVDKFYSIKWIKHMGVKWKVTTVEPQPPRLILSLGGVYNG